MPTVADAWRSHQKMKDHSGWRGKYMVIGNKTGCQGGEYFARFSRFVAPKTGHCDLPYAIMSQTLSPIYATALHSAGPPSE